MPGRADPIGPQLLPHPAVGGQLAHKHRLLPAEGQPLPADTRQQFEPRTRKKVELQSSQPSSDCQTYRVTGR